MTPLERDEFLDVLNLPRKHFKGAASEFTNSQIHRIAEEEDDSLVNKLDNSRHKKTVSNDESSEIPRPAPICRKTSLNASGMKVNVALARKTHGRQNTEFNSKDLSPPTEARNSSQEQIPKIHTSLPPPAMSNESLVKALSGLAKSFEIPYATHDVNTRPRGMTFSKATANSQIDLNTVSTRQRGSSVSNRNGIKTIGSSNNVTTRQRGISFSNSEPPKALSTAALQKVLSSTIEEESDDFDFPQLPYIRPKTKMQKENIVDMTQNSIVPPPPESAPPEVELRNAKLLASTCVLPEISENHKSVNMEIKVNIENISSSCNSLSSPLSAGEAAKSINYSIAPPPIKSVSGIAPPPSRKQNNTTTHVKRLSVEVLTANPVLPTEIFVEPEFQARKSLPLIVTEQLDIPSPTSIILQANPLFKFREVQELKNIDLDIYCPNMLVC